MPDFSISLIKSHIAVDGDSRVITPVEVASGRADDMAALTHCYTGTAISWVIGRGRRLPPVIGKNDSFDNGRPSLG